jgi:hypothetical protein
MSAILDTFRRLLSIGMPVDEALATLQPTTGDRTKWHAAEAAAVPVAVAPEPASRRFNGPRTAYVLTPKALAHIATKGWEPASVMFNTQAQTFAALVSAAGAQNKPVSARELESLTGLVRKTIESTVYHLRNDGWIQSVPLNGTPAPVPSPVATPVSSPDTITREQLQSELKALRDSLIPAAVAAATPTPTKRRTPRRRRVSRK